MKQTLKNLIAEGKTQQTIQQLLEISQTLDDTDLQQQIITQSAFYSKYKQEQLSGIRSVEQEGIALAKINQGLLTIIDQLPEGITINISKQSTKQSIENTPKKDWWKFISSAAVIIGILGGIAELSGFNLRDVFAKSTSENTTPLTLTIKVRDEQGNRPLMGKGQVVVDYDIKTEPRQINDQGNIDLRGVSSHIGKSLSLKLEAKSFTETYPDSTYQITKEAIIFLIKSSCSTCRVFGNVRNQNNYIKGAIVQISGFQKADTTDINGFFELTISPEEEQEEYPVTVLIDDEIVWENYITPSPQRVSEILIQ